MKPGALGVRARAQSRWHPGLALVGDNIPLGQFGQGYVVLVRVSPSSSSGSQGKESFNLWQNGVIRVAGTVIRVLGRQSPALDHPSVGSNRGPGAPDFWALPISGGGGVSPFIGVIFGTAL
jgi:hypothetical protein